MNDCNQGVVSADACWAFGGVFICKKKTEYKHPVGQTLMLRVYDGGCLWCSYVNEVHDAHRRHSPSCVWRHIAPQGDKQGKNRCPDEWDVGASHFGSTCIWLCGYPHGVYWRRQVFRLMSQGLLFCFCEYGLGWYIWWCAVECVRKKLNKNSLWGKLSCFEFLMVDVSDALTWTSSRRAAETFTIMCLTTHCPTGR